MAAEIAMKKIYIILFVSLIINLILVAFIIFDKTSRKLPDNFSWIDYYASSNERLSAQANDSNIVVFIGNSITQNWYFQRGSFFDDNSYICRGIGGQTSTQLLLRFWQDVVAINPKVVVINVGTNDIAGGDGFYRDYYTFNNLKSMVSIAGDNNISVVLTSVIPAKEYVAFWHKPVFDVPEKIDALNLMIKDFAATNDIPYVDYNTQLRNVAGGIDKKYSDDGIHPNAEGYKVMEPIVKATIDSILN